MTPNDLDDTLILARTSEVTLTCSSEHSARCLRMRLYNRRRLGTPSACMISVVGRLCILRPKFSEVVAGKIEKEVEG